MEIETRQLRRDPEDAILTETEKRLLYLEIPGIKHTRQSKDSGSRVNVRYHKRVMELIEGPVRRIHGNNMSPECAIITPFCGQYGMYKTSLQKLRERTASCAAVEAPDGQLCDRTRVQACHRGLPQLHAYSRTWLCSTNSFNSASIMPLR